MPADTQTLRDRPETETGAPQIEVTPAMIEAGIKAHMECDPTVYGYPFEERIVKAIYTAMASVGA